MSVVEILPALGMAGEKNTNDQVWIRIAGFLSLKSQNTQRTYASVISEWCNFLSINPSEVGAASRFVAVNEMYALKYRRWLENRPGQKPRYQKSKASASKELLTGAKKKNIKKDGLQNTLGNATIAKKLVVLRRIYRLLISANLFQGNNPFDSEQVPVPAARSGRKRPTEMVPFEIVKQVMDAPDVTNPKGLRDKVIMVLLFGAGLRRSEVLSLRLGDIRRTAKQTCYLKLRSTKGKVDADQTIPDWAALWVDQLISQRQEQGAEEADYLINSYRGRGGQIPGSEPLSDSGLYRLFCAYCQQVGLDLKVSPHSARATAITRLLDEGYSHREVQEFSRHASVQMVEVYDKRRLGVEKNPAKHLKY